jgi:glycine cleavage system H protein
MGDAYDGGMSLDPRECLPYKRSRFSTRLPVDRRYSPSHFWLKEMEPGVWRIGFTRFATRMLGDLVEHGFSARGGEMVAVGQVIGWVEGFKALTDLYCVAAGEFLGGNPAIEQDPTLIDADPYGEGWLYAVRGTPGEDALDAQGYARVLDLNIAKMLGGE